MRRPVALAILVLVAGCGGGGGGSSQPSSQATTSQQAPPSTPQPSRGAGHNRGPIRLGSPALRNGSTIPRRFTCDGPGHSPPLSWSKVPRGAVRLALVVQDPNTPVGTFWHWVIYNIRPSLRRLAENRVPRGAQQGRNEADTQGWTPPCPPKGGGRHRYVFTLYAQRRPVMVAPDSGPEDVASAIIQASFASSRITVTYGR